MSGFDVQRKNMVESQVRPSDVTDRRVIRAMEAVPREVFVPGDRRFLAYADRDVAIGRGESGGERVLLAPRLMARMIQNLELGEEDLVLEVGTGTGYGAALLARIAQTVVAVECDPAMAQKAGEALGSIGIDNAVVMSGALALGYPAEGPYDAILVSGGVSELPEGLLEQLKHRGRLIAVVVGDGPVGHVVRWQRFDDTYDRQVLFEGSAPMLPGFEAKAQFVF
ncbi:MAG: hypothetical protein RLZ98_2320 [Pseudomonadota bacterium]|jgi:protein-L-isoaspartate(D-aspartate) O-methyltransferase